MATAAVHFVETSEEDSFVAVAQFVGKLLDGDDSEGKADTPGTRFYAKCEGLMAEGKLHEVVNLFIGQIDLIYEKCAQGDARCCVGVISHLIPKLDEARVLSSATALAKAIAAKSGDKIEDRLSGIINLHNVCTHLDAQHAVMMVALGYAKGSRQLAIALLPSVRSRVDEWIKRWKLSDAQARDLLLSLAALLSLVGGKVHIKDSSSLVTRALGLVTANDTAGLTAMKPHAVAAITTFVQMPDAFQCDFADLAVVKSLEKDAQHAPLYKLLFALLAGDIQAYKAAATQAVLTQVICILSSYIFAQRQLRYYISAETLASV